MPGNWTAQWVKRNHVLARVLLERRQKGGQPEYILMSVVPKAFGKTFKKGDTRDAQNFGLISRAGRNGKHRA